jgi:subtilase family serine protease
MPCSFLPRLRPTLAALFVSFLAIGSGFSAVTAAAHNRITTSVFSSAPVEMPNAVHPKVALATDLGPTPGDARLVGMTIRFNMTAAQQAALDQLLADLQNPTSPRYHQWLSPGQFGAQFGLSSADSGQVAAWLSSQGFTVTGIANGGTFITFDGTVGQANAAFSTSIHNLLVNGENHYANISNPSVPGAFASVVSAITGLHDFRPKPRIVTSVARPQFTSSISEGHFIAPGDIYTIYDMNPLLNSGINGAGEAIAVTGQVDISTSDVFAFRSASGLTTTNLPTTVHEGADPGSPPANCVNDNCLPSDADVEESSVDVEWSGATAPSATILFVNGHDVFNNALTGAVDQNLAPIITTSYGLCEAGAGTEELITLNQLFKQANAQGQTVIVAAADNGSTDCDYSSPAVEGLAADFPASSPYVTGMGGTMLNEGSALGATQYWNSNSLSTVANSGSATGYIPEAVWNEDGPGYVLATGGGISAFFTKPAWQVETGPPGMITSVPPDASRDVPDIALDSAVVHDPILFCYLGSCVSGYREANNNLTFTGGTSFDSQMFGGMLALVEQKIGGRIGNANPTLYALGNNALYYNTSSASVFHDITTGNNDDPCEGGSINCPGPNPIGYSAGVGYDLNTGWGSVDLYNLASAWNKVTPLGNGSLGPNMSTTGLVASSTSVAAQGTGSPSVTLTATVTGSNGTPTGTVQFLVNNTIVGSGTLNGSGIATYAFATSCSGLGQYVMSASYSGDPNYAGSKGPALDALGAGFGGYPVNQVTGSVEVSPLIVTVTSAGGTCPDFTVTPANSSITVAAGGTIPAATITAGSSNSFSGTVVFSDTVTTTSDFLPNITFIPTTVNVTATTPATTSLNLTGITAGLRMPGLPGPSGPGRSGPWYAAGSGVTVAGLLLIALPRRRRLGGLLVLALSIALALGAAGCGGNKATAPAANPYAGTYVITITATGTVSGAVTSHSTMVTYIIN